jgi:hypothetical protein
MQESAPQLYCLSPFNGENRSVPLGFEGNSTKLIPSGSLFTAKLSIIEINDLIERC